MKGDGSGRSEAERIALGLTIVAALLAAAIVGGTAFALAGGKRPPESRPAEAAQGAAKASGYFTGIGTIRAESAGRKPAAVVVSIAFPYDPADSAFSEELASKTKRMREETAAFFASIDAEKLRGMGEDQLKEALLERYNSLLRLGRIGVLYFNDYLLID